MLTKESILKALGMTEEQINEAKIDVDKLVKESQTLGDNIQKKYVDETTKTLTEQHKKEIAELGKKIKEETTAPIKTDDEGLTPATISKLIADGIAEAVKPLQEKEAETTINSFKNKATEKGYSEEQVNYFVSSTKKEALSDFNFDLFPIGKDGDSGTIIDTKDPKTKEQEMDEEAAKRKRK